MVRMSRARQSRMQVEASRQEVMARVGEQLFDWQLLDWAEEAAEARKTAADADSEASSTVQVLATLEGSGLQADWALSSGRVRRRLDK